MGGALIALCVLSAALKTQPCMIFALKKSSVKQESVENTACAILHPAMCVAPNEAPAKSQKDRSESAKQVL